MPEVTTILNRVRRAKELVQSAVIKKYWLGLGNINTSWENENLPPSVNPNLKELPELLGAVYISTISLVAEDEEGDIYTNLGRYRAYDISQDENILMDKLAVNVYCAIYLDSTQLPVGITYRSLGLLENLTTNKLIDYNMGFYIKSSDILSYDLLWINTIPPKIISNNTLEQLQLIIEF